MTAQPDAKQAIKRKANDLRKTLAQLDKLTGQSFTVTRLADVAKFFDVSAQAVDKWRAAGMPGVRNNYDLHAIVVWLRSVGPWRPDSCRKGETEDLSIEGPESEWSEEYRKWKARIAEVEYQERIDALMSVDRSQRLWADTVMPLVRGFAERVIAAHGNGTAQDWEDVVRQIDEAIDRELGERNESDGTPGLEEMDGEPTEAEHPHDDSGVGGEEDPPSCAGTVPGADVPPCAPPG